MVTNSYADLEKAILEIDQFYLFGWKQIAKFIGVGVRTAKRWHYEKLRLPIRRFSFRNHGQTRIMVEKLIVMSWVDELSKL